MNIKKSLFILLIILILGLIINYQISGDTITNYKLDDAFSIFVKLCIAFLGLSMLITKKKDTETR